VLTRWAIYVHQLKDLVENVIVSDSDQARMQIDQGFSRWREWATDLRSSNRTVFLIGNGASASMASHYAADLAKNAHLGARRYSASLDGRAGGLADWAGEGPQGEES
jgi:D-sedoheptulose 7-phosphate isomerase